MMKYQQLALEERVLISHLVRQGFNLPEIARQMGRHRSTISRELRRNRCHGIDNCYRHSRAHRRTVARRRRSRRNRHHTHKDFAIVRRLLKKEWSPEQIVGIIRHFKLMQRRMSHETIYQYIWRDKKAGGQLWRHLRNRVNGVESATALTITAADLPGSAISPSFPDRLRRATSGVTGRSIRS